jgi:hypothetical protein
MTLKILPTPLRNSLPIRILQIGWVNKAVPGLSMTLGGRGLLTECKEFYDQYYEKVDRPFVLLRVKRSSAEVGNPSIGCERALQATLCLCGEYFFIETRNSHFLII